MFIPICGPARKSLGTRLFASALQEKAKRRTIELNIPTIVESPYLACIVDRVIGHSKISEHLELTILSSLMILTKRRRDLSDVEKAAMRKLVREWVAAAPD